MVVSALAPINKPNEETLNGSPSNYYEQRPPRMILGPEKSQIVYLRPNQNYRPTAIQLSRTTDVTVEYTAAFVGIVAGYVSGQSPIWKSVTAADWITLNVPVTAIRITNTDTDPGDVIADVL